MNRTPPSRGGALPLPQRVRKAPTLECHCEPVRRLVWQSPTKLQFYRQKIAVFPQFRGLPRRYASRNDIFLTYRGQQKRVCLLFWEADPYIISSVLPSKAPPEIRWRRGRPIQGPDCTGAESFPQTGSVRRGGCCPAAFRTGNRSCQTRQPPA